MSVESMRSRIQAEREQRILNKKAKPANSGGAPAWAGADPSTGMPAQSPGTPRLNNLSLTNPNATQDSNRSGAFGTGAQNLQGRRDLFQEMGSAKNFDTPEFKARAHDIGVTESGWANAARKLSPSWGAAQPAVAATPAPAAAPAAAAAPMVTAKPATLAQPAMGPPAPVQQNQNTLAATAPTPNPPPAAPLPGQAKVGQPAAPAPPVTAASPVPIAPRPTWQQVSGAAPLPQSAAPATPVVAATPAATPASLGAGSRNIGILNTPGMYSNAVNSVAKPVTNAIYNTGAKSFIQAANLTGQAEHAEKLAKLADVAKNTSKTGTAAREAYRAAAAAQEAIAAQKLGAAASLTRTGNVIEKVGNAASKAGKVASLGKFGAGLGKASPWVMAAQIAYETGALATDGKRREQRTNELEQATTGNGKSLGAGMARGALEGALNPAATIYATGAHIGKWNQSSNDAKASKAALHSAEQRFQKRKEAREKYGPDWNSLSHAKKQEIYAASGTA